jgi:hypothetical protein
MNHKDTIMKKIIPAIFVLALSLAACTPRTGEQKEEQIRITEGHNDTTYNSVQGNIALDQIPTSPNSVVLTGLKDQRLITVYKYKVDTNKEKNRSSWANSNDFGGSEYAIEEHYMPGLDILRGYNLLNLVHYDMKTGKHNFLFDHPALIKTLYFPSFVQDSLDKKPINRNYFLISGYDEDTNKDSLINRKDLRRLYHFNDSCTVVTRLIPKEYSVLRSQYDSQNDAMYIFARQDINKNGISESNEPLHVFLINLKAPAEAKLMY